MKKLLGPKKNNFSDFVIFSGFVIFFKKNAKLRFKNKKFFKKIKNKDFFNLKKYVHSQLKALNIKKIDIINKDTFNPKNSFFSARRSISRNENDYGRNISVIMINS